MKKRIIFFDFETSGLNKTPFDEELPSGGSLSRNDADQVLSGFFLVVDEDGAVLERMGIRLGGRGDIIPKADAIAVNGMSPRRMKGLSEKDASEKIRALFVRHGGRNAVLAGHNASGFDTPILRSLLTRNGIDADVIPGAEVDTFIEARRAWVRQNKPESGYKLNPSDPKDSMKLGSACKRHGVDFDASKAHDAQYDVEATYKLWISLGRPISSQKSAADSPYELNKANGKSVSLKTIQGANYSEQNITVVGGTIRKVETATGIKNLQDIYYIDESKVPAGFRDQLELYCRSKAILSSDIGGAEADKAAENFESSRSFLVKALSKPADAVKKRGFAGRFTPHNLIESTDDIRPSDLVPKQSFKGVEPAAELSSLINELYVDKAEAEIQIDQQKIYEEYTRMFSGIQPDSTQDEILQKPVSPIVSGDNNFIPLLAERFSSLTPIQRRILMINIMGDKGYAWAGSMLELAEKYGVRNGLHGFEDKRLSLLQEQLPAAWKSSSQIISIDELFPGARSQKILKDSGAVSFEFTANGRILTAALRFNNGDIVTSDIEYPKQEAKGSPHSNLLESKLTQKYLAEELVARFQDINTSGAEAIAGALKIGPLQIGPDRSYERYKSLLRERLERENAKEDGQKNQNIINALNETLDCLGGSYQDMADKIKASPFLSVEEHDEQFGSPIIEGGLSEDEAILQAYDDARADYLYTNGKTLAPSEETPHSPTLLDTKMGAGEKQLSLNHCKICLRQIKSRKSVSGIGPKCAKRLREFIESPMHVASNAHRERPITDIEKDYKTNGDAKRYPIMLVRKGEDVFVADIVEKKASGQTVMINLTKLAKKAGTKKEYKESTYKNNHDRKFYSEFGLEAGDSDLMVLKVFGED